MLSALGETSARSIPQNFLARSDVRERRAEVLTNFRPYIARQHHHVSSPFVGANVERFARNIRPF